MQHVLSKKFQAGAVKETVFDKYKFEGLRVIGRSRHIAEHVFIASNKLNLETKQQLKKSLLTITATDLGKQILYKIKPKSKSLQTTTDENFNSLREYLNIKTRFKWDFNYYKI